MAIVRNLDPSSTIIEQRYDQPMPEYLPWTYEMLEAEGKDRLLNAIENDCRVVEDLLPATPYREADPSEFAMGEWRRRKPPFLRSRLMPIRHRAQFRKLPTGSSAG